MREFIEIENGETLPADSDNKLSAWADAGIANDLLRVNLDRVAQIQKLRNAARAGANARVRRQAQATLLRWKRRRGWRSARGWKKRGNGWTSLFDLG